MPNVAESNEWADEWTDNFHTKPKRRTYLYQPILTTKYDYVINFPNGFLKPFDSGNLILFFAWKERE